MLLAGMVNSKSLFPRIVSYSNPRPVLPQGERRDNLALMRLDIEALVESAAIDCEIWVAKAGDDGEIGSAAIFVPAGKAVGGTQGHMTS